jgi:Acetylornithine deacetylase/Succinyl-diaminopimelate desuccinylase and related deacylases
MAFIADFPLIHSATFIKKEVINTYSLLYTVEGTTKGKLPYLLASHLDVVPVDPSTWEVPPFGGKIVNRTYIYGRGAIDDKAGVLVSQINKDSSAWFDKSQRTVGDIPQFYYAWIPCYAADCTALCPTITDSLTISLLMCHHHKEQ